MGAKPNKWVPKEVKKVEKVSSVKSEKTITPMVKRQSMVKTLRGIRK